MTVFTVSSSLLLIAHELQNMELQHRLKKGFSVKTVFLISWVELVRPNCNSPPSYSSQELLPVPPTTLFSNFLGPRLVERRSFCKASTLPSSWWSVHRPSLSFHIDKTETLLWSEGAAVKIPGRLRWLLRCFPSSLRSKSHHDNCWQVYCRDVS